MAKKFKVSQSKVKCWQQCRFAYNCKYVEKLKKRTIKRPFTFGTLVHSILEARAKGEKKPLSVLDKIPLKQQKLFAAEREMYGDILNDIRFIMTDYFKFYKDDGLTVISKHGVAAEHEFLLPLDKEIDFSGKIDLVVKKSSLRWLVEHKTFGRSIPKPDHLWRNLQSAVYLRVLDMLGWKSADGVMWDYIHSKPPSRVQVTKKGLVSKKKLYTLPSAVKFSLESNGLDVEDYQPLIKAAEINRQNYYKRIFNPVNSSVVDTVFKGFIDTSREMLKYHGKSKTRTFGRHCEWCDYEPICRAELTGADADYIRERDYYVEDEIKEERDEEN